MAKSIKNRKEYKPNGYWTKDRCIAEAKKYKTSNNWRKNNEYSLSVAIKKGWYTEIKNKYLKVYSRESTRYWTEEKCLAEAKKYKTVKKFKLHSLPAYKAIKRYKYNRKIIMGHLTTNRRIWSKAAVIEAFQKAKCKSDLWNDCPAAIKASRKLGIYDELIKKFYKPPKPKIVKIPRIIIKNLTDVELINYIQNRIKGKCRTRHEFSRKFHYLYTLARKRRILNKICKEMESGIKLLAEKRRLWTFERIREEASKYNTRYNFKKGNGSAYGAACRLDILEDVCKHMVPGNQKYTDEFLLKEALKFYSKEEFREKAKALYTAIWERGLYFTATAHMFKRIRNLEEKDYKKFDKIFKTEFKIYETNRKRKLFGFAPDRVLEKDGIFYIVEIKRDKASHNSNDQLLRYKTKGKELFKSKLGGVYLASLNGKYTNSYSFKDLFDKLIMLHR